MGVDNNNASIYSKMQYKFASGLFHDLNRSKCPYVVVKGSPLAYYKTGNPGTRLSGDIDLLTPRENINQIDDILRHNGYLTSYVPNRNEHVLMLASSHQILPYKKMYGKFELQIDVNFDLFWGEFGGPRIDIAEFMEDAIWLEVYGYKIKTLPPLKMLVLLILHHYKEMNSVFYLMHANPIKKRFFEDVYYLCKSYIKEISPQNLYDLSLKYQILPYVYYLFYYTSKVYDDRMLDTYLDVLYSNEGEDLLNCYGLTAQERKEWLLSFEERLERDISEIIRVNMTKTDREKLMLSKKLYGCDTM